VSAALLRLRLEWRRKALLTLALPVVFCLGYFPLQRFPLSPARSFTPTWLDAAVSFDPRWVYVYLSLYLLTPLPWLATSATELRRYTRGFAALCAAAFATFAVVPVAAPRPSVAAQGLYALLVRYDSPLNSFPSLHVAIAAYTLRFAARILPASPRVIAALGAWVGAIAWATLALKQHLVVDLPPALVLAWAADRMAWRHCKGDLDAEAPLAPVLDYRGRRAVLGQE
jgi:hypothetical protein